MSRQPDFEGLAAFAARLKQSLAGRSIRAVAKEAKVSDAAIHKWLTAIAEPSRDRLVSVAQVLGVSVGWLAAGEDTGRAAADPINKHKLAITLNMVLETLQEESGGTDAATAAEFVTGYYLEWQRTGRQPARVFTIVPRRTRR